MYPIIILILQIIIHKNIILPYAIYYLIQHNDLKHKIIVYILLYYIDIKKHYLQLF